MITRRGRKMELKDKRIVITGGAGFIGSNLAHRLCKDNKVTVIDNMMSGRKENLEGADVRFVESDINDEKVLQEEFKDADYVLHQAALCSVQRSVDDPIASNTANVDGTLKVLIAARDSGVKRVVYAASSSAYGDTPELPKREDMKTNPQSPYAITKLTGEYYCRTFSDLFDLDTVSLRYFNIFGPRQDPHSVYSAVIPLFIKAIIKGEQPVIFGDGKQSRDFTYIENVVHANILACLAEKTRGEVINIACADRIDLLELVEMINEMLGKDIKPEFDKERPGDVKHSLADYSKAKQLIGYEPKVSFKEGLRKTVEWYGDEDMHHKP